MLLYRQSFSSSRDPTATYIFVEKHFCGSLVFNFTGNFNSQHKQSNWSERYTQKFENGFHFSQELCIQQLIADYSKRREHSVLAKIVCVCFFGQISPLSASKIKPDYVHLNPGSINSADMGSSYLNGIVGTWSHHQWFLMGADLIFDDSELALVLSGAHSPTPDGGNAELA